MKVIEVTKYVADDGTLFDTAQECEYHEQYERIIVELDPFSAYGALSSSDVATYILDNFVRKLKNEQK